MALDLKTPPAESVTTTTPARRFLSADASTRIIGLLPLAGLVAVLVFFGVVTDGNLLSQRNIVRILVQALPLVVGAVGAAFIFSQNAVDLSMGSVLGLSAVVTAYVSQANTALAVVAAVLVGAAVGAFNGTLHGKLKINPLILTLAVAFIIRGLLQPLTGYGSVAAGRGFDAFNTNELKIAAVAALCIVAYVVYEHSPYGRRAGFVGASAAASTQSGISPARMKTLGFIVAGVAAALAGVLTVMRSGTALPSTGTMFEFDVIIALVLGGMPVNGGPESRIKSALVGALLLTFLTAGMTMWGLDEYAQQITKGVVFVVVLSASFALTKKRA